MITWLIVIAVVVALLIWKELARIRIALESLGRRRHRQVTVEAPPPKTDLDVFCEARARTLRIQLQETSVAGTMYVTCESEQRDLLAIAPTVGRGDVIVIVDESKSPMLPLAADFRQWVRRAIDESAKPAQPNPPR